MHAALLYRSEREYLDAVVPFILDGLRADQPVLVALPTGNLALVKAALDKAAVNKAAVNVAMVDLGQAGRNPGRVLALEADFAAAHPGRAVRMVGEVLWPGRSSDEYPACVVHEALVNTAFAGQPAIGLCPFDVGRLAEPALLDALLTHPLLWQDGSAQRNDHYAPGAALTRHNQPLAGNPTGASYTVTRLADLAAARSFASRYASWLGVPAESVAKLQLIVTELATNSLQHANSSCRLAFWRRDGRLVCEARDTGRLVDPLAGRLPAKSGDGTGRGLFLVHALADLVRHHSTANGTTIQVQLQIAAGCCGPGG